MSSNGSHIGKGGHIRNNAHPSQLMGMAPMNGGAPQQQQGFVQRAIPPGPPRGGFSVPVAGAQFPPYHSNPFPPMIPSTTSTEEVPSLSFGDLAVSTPSRLPNTPALYSNPSFPPNAQHQPGIPIPNSQSHMGPGAAHGVVRASGMRPGSFPMPSMPLGMPQAMMNGAMPGMMPPHMMMMPPGMPPAFFGMPQQPLGNIQPPVLSGDIPNQQENVLSHMNRKRVPLKFFPADDSQQADDKDAPPPPSTSDSSDWVVVAPPVDVPVTVTKTDNPSPRAATSAHSSGGSPRAATPSANTPSLSDNHHQHHTVSHASHPSSAPTEAAAPASSAALAEDSKTPAAAAASSSPHAPKQPHARASMNILGSAISPSAPAPHQPRTTPSAAHRGQSTAASAAASQSTAISGAGRTVYTRELLLELQKRPYTPSQQLLDKINFLKLGPNCVNGAGMQGGRAPHTQNLPFPSALKRLPMGNKAGAGGASNHGRAPQQKHSISENSFVAKMQKMSDDVAERKKKNIQLILNQLTAENFEKLCDKLFKEIDSLEVLEIVQTKIYDKAVLDQQQNPAPGQPTFVELYARVCHIIVQDNQRIHPVTGDPGKLFFVTADQPPEEAKGGQFRRSLLNRCQEEFGRAPHDRCEGLQLQSEVDRYNQEMKEKRRALGNVDFVGQLFLHGLLAEKTLHHCFKLLLEKHYERFDSLSQPGSRPLQDSDFDQLESFCKLLTAVGRTVDRPLAKHMMDGYFGYLSQIMSQPTIIPRMKFHIEQIIELRRCNWDQASMRQERCAPTSSGKAQKASMTLLQKPAPGTAAAKPTPVPIPSKLAPSKPSSPTIKQNPSSKPANGKTPTASNANGSSSSFAPAAPEVDPMSRPLAYFLELRETDQDPIDAQHMRSLDAMLEEWACNHLHSEVATCLCELNQPYTHALFVHDIVTQCCDKGPSFFVKCVELLETLCRKPNCLNEEKFDEALRYLGSEKFEKEMRLDLPSYLDFLALIVARGKTTGWIKPTLELQVFQEKTSEEREKARGERSGYDVLRAALAEAAEGMCASAESDEEN